MTPLNAFRHSLKSKFNTSVLLALLALLALSAPALGQDRSRNITLPQQPLQESLTAIGKLFGTTIVAPGELVRGKTAPAISGQFTPVRAVNRLLEGSGLGARQSSSGAITVQAGENVSAALPTSPALRLAPVIVTGERTERSMHETASSASVLSGKEIDNTPAFKEVDDVLQNIPNVDLGGNSNEGPTIRGVKAGGPLNGVYGFFGGARPRTTTSVDGRPISYDEFIFGATSLWDTKRVEVFRGPQTTSQGVNSIGGAIHVVTEDPTFDYHAKALSEMGDYSRARVAVAASGPIIDNELAIRLAVDLQQKDTVLNMPVTANYGPNPNHFKNGALRGKILWEPSQLPDLKMKLTLSQSQTETPQAEYVKTKGSIRELDAISTNMPSRRMVSNSAVHDVSYQITEQVELSNRFVYSNLNSRRYVSVANSGEAKIKKGEGANETTMRWKSPDTGLSGLVGVYYQRGEADEYLNYSLSGKGTFNDVQTSSALYSEMTYDITDDLDLTFGLRYEQDQQKRTGKTTGGALYNVNLDYDTTFSAILPKVVLGYDISKDLRVGALVSKGFNPGGVTVLYSDGTTNTFDEESVWNYELFARAALLDNRMNLNANLFYADYKDYQTSRYYGLMGASVVYAIGNADKAHSYGLELSADYLATDSLRLFAGLGLLNTKIDKYSGTGGGELEGASFMRSPNITASIGADYEILKGLRLGGRARYVGNYNSEDSTNSIAAGDYVVCDAQASYDLDRFTLYGYVNNVFDEFYTVSELRINRAIVGNPREFGLGVKYSF